MSAKPVVYFIDDSATMREVIKIAFRREDLEVITCHDASSAMDLMDHSAPDVVITDVIMPGPRRLRGLPVHQAASALCANPGNSDVRRGE